MSSLDSGDALSASTCVFSLAFGAAGTWTGDCADSTGSDASSAGAPGAPPSSSEGGVGGTAGDIANQLPRGGQRCNLRNQRHLNGLAPLTTGMSRARTSI